MPSIVLCIVTTAATQCYLRATYVEMECMMLRKLAAITVGLLAVVGVGAGADAGESLSRTAVAAPSELDPLGSFTVTFSQCWNFESVVFEFQGEQKTAACQGADVTLSAETDQLVEQLPPTGTATASFTAPADGGTYTGTATAVSQDDLQGIRGPAATRLTNGNRVAQAACDPNVCATFQVTVRQATTTTAATTTTTATTIAPTTTAVGAVPPSPTTTAVTTLPATGSDSNGMLSLIAVLLIAGGATLFVVARVRKPHATGG